MSIQELPFAPFTGLNLPDTSAETPLGSLAEATNILVSDAGGAVQKPGYTLTATDHSAVQYAFVHMEGTTPQYIVLDSSGNWQIYTRDVSSLQAGSSGASGPASAAAHCQMLPSALATTDPDTYVASRTANMHRWTGTAWTDLGANSPRCGALAQTGFSERLVATAFTAGATNGPNDQPVSGSTVYFSDASTPGTFTTGNYVELTPGDGEDIVDGGAVTYNNQVFVFKKSSFFVFYDEVASGGAVDFLFHERTGVGLAVAGAVVASPIGVFFQGADGIYLTTGGDAVKVSGDIDGLFTGRLPAWTSYGRFIASPATPLPKMAVSGDYLYCAVSNVSSGGARCDKILAYNFRRQAWTIWDNEAATLATMPWGNDVPYPILIGIGHNGSNYRAATWYPTTNTDNAAFMPVNVQLNWFHADFGEGSIGLDQAMVLRLEAWGKGKGTVGVCVDYAASPAATKTIDFGEMETPPQWMVATWNNFEWPSGTYATTDLLRLSPPTRKYASNLNGRGNFLSLRFNKVSTSSFFYLERPRATLIGR
jgi:hypothetical protein